MCVFCGSSTGQDPAFGADAAELGRALARHSVRLVYGGSSVGLMDIVAENCFRSGGEIVGIITDQLMDLEVGKPELSDLRIVRTMAERKMMMFEESDAFLVLPGGVGTMDELFEALAFTRLALHDKPIGLLNTSGFYAPLTKLLDCMYDEGFSPASSADSLVTGDTPEALIQELLRKLQ